jgi:hypothetical protein
MFLKDFCMSKEGIFDDVNAGTQYNSMKKISRG